MIRGEAQILQWIYAASMDLDCRPVKEWAEGVMANAAGFRPGHHTLAAAGQLSCQGMDDWDFNLHASVGQDESPISISFPSRTFTSLPTILYASVFQAL